jgi:hypothetical protein
LRFVSDAWTQSDTRAGGFKRQGAELEPFFDLLSNAALCRSPPRRTGGYNLGSPVRHDWGPIHSRTGSAQWANRPLVHPLRETLEDRQSSWKEIAAYLRRDVTTVQRWEKREGMPVHQHVHDRMG